eukprot:TRINITY_DN5766_c0_g1_i1.p1 TRINITY_DN5766_c0_g1~~TRINITY_DN5766_c0_g1_i1.p1  ORF type:complete len:733 (+),score=58.66 TRINITY_DN5766_c0_g1_i1:74-2272(+)
MQSLRPLFAFLWLSAGAFANQLASWRVRLTKGTNTWQWDINELEFHGNEFCNDTLKGTGYVESGHYGDDPHNFWSPDKAFDGNPNTGWGGRGPADGRFLGVVGLSKPVRCVRILQHFAQEIAVEKLIPSGSWSSLVTQGVAEGQVATVVVPGCETFCKVNQHVLHGKCVTCPQRSTKPAGDDPLGPDTGCLCAADFHVKDGVCVQCPHGKKNDAGDDTSKGDSICDFVPTSSFMVGSKLAMHLPWTWFVNGGLTAKPKVVRDIHAAACRDQLFISWTSQVRRPFDYNNQWQTEGDTFGHVSVFKMGAGELKMTDNVKFSMCSEMGGLTASSDCSVIGALCVSRRGPRDGFPNFKKNLVETTKDDSGRPPFGWRYMDREVPDPRQKESIQNAYLLEWTGGTVTQVPDSSVLVNEAIGGWRYGTWAVSLNSNATLYSFSLKTTIYGGGLWHQGAVHFAMSRPDYVWVPRRGGWGCGTGHVLWNAQTYNSAKDRWGRWCWLDGNAEGSSSYAAWFQQDDGPAVDVQDLPPINGENGKMGGPTDLVSRGSDGWLGVLTSPSTTSSNQQRVGLAKIPCANSDRRCQDQPVTWLGDLVQRNKGAGFAKLSRVGSTDESSDRFLLGWAQYNPSQDLTWPVVEKFFVAEVDHTGALKSEIRELGNTGWTERTDWVVIPETGCVAWAHAWSDSIGPKGDYGSWESSRDDMYSDKLHISTYCPQRPTCTQNKTVSSGEMIFM